MRRTLARFGLLGVAAPVALAGAAAWLLWLGAGDVGALFELSNAAFYMMPLFLLPSLIAACHRSVRTPSLDATLRCRFDALPGAALAALAAQSWPAQPRSCSSGAA